MPISYWLTKLPKEYAELAKHYYKTHGLDYKVNSLHDAILHMDAWTGADEGEQFWYAVSGYGYGKCALPPIPNSTPKPPEPHSKPIIEWLRELPEPYYMLAIKNYGEDCTIDEEVDNLDDAIRSMVEWEDTKEGIEFWEAVCSWANKESPNLPKIPLTPTRIQEMVESKTPESLAQIIVDQEKLIHSLQDHIKCADNALGRASKFAKKLKAKVKHLKQTHRDKGDGISICLTEIQSILNKANQINQ